MMPCDHPLPYGSTNTGAVTMEQLFPGKERTASNRGETPQGKHPIL